ncbi:MAG: glycosyltransferase family 2 protein [Melioribacteraceae bacterium]
MGNNPLVTVNILSYNRKDELRNTLSKVYEQDYKNIEVIVVDNASTDGSPEMVEIDFSNVILIKMQKNIGIAGWNEGFKVAKGEYIMTLDDDSYPSENTIVSGIKEFCNDEKLGVVTFNVYNTNTNTSETKDYFSHDPYLFHGCGAMFRKSVIDQVGKFNEMIFIYYHELDYGARVYNAGYKIKYLSGSLVYHEQSLRSRGLNGNESDPFKSEYRYFHHFVSYSIILIQRFSWHRIIIYLPKWILNRLIICIYNNYYKSFLKAIVYLIWNSKKILNGGEKLKKEVQKFYRYGNEALVDRKYFPNFRKPRLFR